MKKPFLTITVLFAALTLTQCAKHRPVEEIDAKRNWLKKEDFLQKDGKPSTWLYKVTVIRVSPNSGPFNVALQSQMKLGHFEFTVDDKAETGQLRFVNDVNIFRQGSDAVTEELLNSWKITHNDVKLAESDGNVTNREEEDHTKAPEKRRYFSIDFASAKITETDTFPYTRADVNCWTPINSALEQGSLDVSPDYISFVVQVDYKINKSCGDIRRGVRYDLTKTVHFRYSFRRDEPSSYQPYVYAGEEDPMMKKFGYFHTIREGMAKDGRFRNFTMMNRWNPETEHHFFFSKDFPEKWKFIYNDPKLGVFARTNQMLEAKGSKARFYIHENTDIDGKEKHLGDLRYSFITFVDELDEGAPLGYGPSDAHPLTGEIIAATSTIWTGMLEYYKKVMALRTERDTKKFSESSLYKQLSEALQGDPHNAWTLPVSPTEGTAKLVREAFVDILPEFTYGYPGWANFTSKEELESKLKIEAKAKIAAYGNMQNYEAIMDALNGIEKTAQQVKLDEMSRLKHERNSTIYPIEPVLGQMSMAFANGMDAEDAIRAVVYNTCIHEFGHNLGLRHNFYGSVDQANMAPGTHTSSVMEYLGLVEDMYSSYDWQAYDKAALGYGYAGAVDKEHNFLFCTDEHLALNALCNHFDVGTMPSEVAMSLIANYESSYDTRNNRFERAYWDTSGYDAWAFKTMYDLKRFLLMWRTSMTEGEVQFALSRSDFLKKNSQLDDYDVGQISRLIPLEVQRAAKLSAAFYQAVIQQADSDRPYLDRYVDWNGELKRKGILPDKIYATYFLAGDDGFMYNPNRQLPYASYLAFVDEPEMASVMDDLFRNLITERVDATPWFIGLGRSLFAAQASSSANQDDASLIEKIGVKRYTAKELVDNFGIREDEIVNRNANMIIDTKKLTLPMSKDSDFEAGELVGITKYNGMFYMVSKRNNSYAFTIILKLIENQDQNEGSSSVTYKKDILELYNLYMDSIGDRRN